MQGGSWFREQTYMHRLARAGLAFAFLLTLSLGLVGCRQQTVHLKGAGASFPGPIYARWRALYHRQNPHVKIAYQAIGSGGGIRAITARAVDFGASDALLTARESEQLPAPLLTIPTIIGAVVLTYNLPGLTGTQLVLSSDVVADIYLGKIRLWDDERIAVLNPDVALPTLPIRVTHRSDSSGTTFIFTDYLSAVSPAWRAQIGRGKKVAWPTSGKLTGNGAKFAGKGNDGVAHRVLLEAGGIGYVELRYALNAGLPYALLVNRAGEAVGPTPQSVQEAERKTPASPENWLKPSIVNAAGEGSYPIAAFTYLLIYEDLTYLTPDKAHALVDFLSWLLTEGQPEAQKLHYAPLPEAVRREALQRLQGLRLPEPSKDSENPVSSLSPLEYAVKWMTQVFASR